MKEAKETKTTFQLVYKVLSELYEQVKSIHGDAADNKIKAAMTGLSKSYGNLTDDKMPPIDYSDPTTRFAYVYKYVASHAGYVQKVLDRVDHKLSDELLKQKKIVISCLGGGPGSELVGFLHHVLSAADAEVEVLTCYLCDREQAWADSWTEIGQELDADIKLFVNFQRLDVTQKEDWAKQRKFLSADLFISSYFASEVVRVKDQAADFWKDVCSNAKESAQFLFIDNAHDAFIGYVAEIAEQGGLTSIAAAVDDMIPPWNEQMSDLHEFLVKFGHSPKLKSRLFYDLYTKK